MGDESALRTPMAKKTGGEGATGHIVLVVLSCVELCFLGAVLADGRSLMRVETNPNPIAACQGSGCVDFTIRNFTRQAGPYGIGVHHDMYAYGWGKLGYSATPTGGMDLRDTLDTFNIQSKGSMDEVSAAVYTKLSAKLNVLTQTDQFHIGAFLDCRNFNAVGTMMAACCFAATLVAFIQVLASGLSLSDPATQNMWTVHFALQILLFVCMIIAVSGNSAIYDYQWDCSSRMVPSFTAKDHFDMAYGTYLLWIVTIFALFGVGNVWYMVPDAAADADGGEDAWVGEEEAADNAPDKGVDELADAGAEKVAEEAAEGGD